MANDDILSWGNFWVPTPSNGTVRYAILNTKAIRCRKKREVKDGPQCQSTWKKSQIEIFHVNQHAEQIYNYLYSMVPIVCSSLNSWNLGGFGVILRSNLAWVNLIFKAHSQQP